MNMYNIISKKKYGNELSKAEIEYFVDGFLSGEVPDYQASALLMAICLKGMTEAETVYLTKAMASSGDMVDLSCFGSLSADKHSTGGVGDKTSLIVGSIIAALGGKVAKMSGRGLGHTGGTVDKLESIPGFKTEITEEEFISQTKRVGIAIIGQTGNLTPADKKIYALRDVTATVDSIPLITSSIMSKKLAAGSKNIVLDVKFGSGAFMKTKKSAEILAKEMVKIGTASGRNIAAVITNMDIPLGKNIGNSLEIIEAVKVLKNEVKNDLLEVSVELSKTLAMLIFGYSKKVALEKVWEVLLSGAAYEKMKEWISAQGGDISYIEDTNKFEKAKFFLKINSKEDGYIFAMDTEKIGNLCTMLGAGRTKKEDIIDSAAGIILEKKTGDFVDKGDLIATVFTNNESVLKNVESELISAIKICKKKPKTVSTVYKTIVGRK